MLVLALALSGCGGQQARDPASACVSEETRTALRRQLDADGLWPAGALARGNWEVALTQATLDAYDPDTQRARCSAVLWLRREGAPMGMSGGRQAYVVQPYADGGMNIGFEELSEDSVPLFLAVQQVIQADAASGP